MQINGQYVAASKVFSAGSLSGLGAVPSMAVMRNVRSVQPMAVRRNVVRKVQPQLAQPQLAHSTLAPSWSQMHPSGAYSNSAFWSAKIRLAIAGIRKSFSYDLSPLAQRIANDPATDGKLVNWLKSSFSGPVSMLVSVIGPHHPVIYSSFTWNAPDTDSAAWMLAWKYLAFVCTSIGPDWTYDSIRGECSKVADLKPGAVYAGPWIPDQSGAPSGALAGGEAAAVAGAGAGLIAIGILANLALIGGLVYIGYRAGKASCEKSASSASEGFVAIQEHGTRNNPISAPKRIAFMEVFAEAANVAYKATNFRTRIKGMSRDKAQKEWKKLESDVVWRAIDEHISVPRDKHYKHDMTIPESTACKIYDDVKRFALGSVREGM